MANKYYHPDTDFLRKLGAAPPIFNVHGTDDDIRSKLKPLKATSWRSEGNKLIGTTEMGEIVQFIPTDYICKGIDEEGLPILEKIVI